MGAGTGTRLAGLGLGGVTFTAPVQAASISMDVQDPFVLAGSAAVLATVALMGLVVRHLSKRERAARLRLGDMEIRLNEAEAALSAETHVLVIWRGRDSEPERMVGSMHGAAAVPADVEGLLDFRGLARSRFGRSNRQCPAVSAQFRNGLQYRRAQQEW